MDSAGIRLLSGLGAASLEEDDVVSREGVADVTEAKSCCDHRRVRSILICWDVLVSAAIAAPLSTMIGEGEMLETAEDVDEVAPFTSLFRESSIYFPISLIAQGGLY